MRNIDTSFVDAPAAADTFRTRLARFNHDQNHLRIEAENEAMARAKTTAASTPATKSNGRSTRSSSRSPAMDIIKMSEETTTILPAAQPPATTKKRKLTTSTTDHSTTTPKPKKSRFRTSTTVLSNPTGTTHTNNLRDSVQPNLILISIGLNPGLTTGLLGHAYAHPANKYWPMLHKSGITPMRHHPPETDKLMTLYGLGHTNIVAHKATSGGNDLTPADFAQGCKDLDEKIRAARPEAVCLVGKSIFEQWFKFVKGRNFRAGKDEFRYGWQEEEFWVGRTIDAVSGEVLWPGARTFNCTTTSPRATQFSEAEMVEIWRPLGQWFAPKRETWVRDRENKEKGEVAKEKVIASG